MWKKHTIEPNKNYCLSLGELKINISKADKQWLVKSEYHKEAESGIFEATQEKVNTLDCRVFSTDKDHSLCILPAMPDKPLVIRPKTDFKLQPKSSMQLKVRIPVWVQLYHNSAKKENLIYEAPSKILSKTWIGEPDSGHLAYAFPIHPKGEQPNSVYLATCPVKISNESTNILDFQRFLLHTDQLALYIADNALFTSDVHVKFKGENSVSDLQYANQKPEGVENAKKIADPRNSDKKGALKRSFYFIKSLTQY